MQQIRYDLFAGNSPANAITAIRLSNYGEVVVKLGIVDDLDDENRTETALYVCVEWNEYVFENVISIQSRKFLYKFIIPYVRAILAGDFEIIMPSRLRSMYLKVEGRVPWKHDFYLIKIFDRDNHVLITQNLRLDFD